MREKCTKKPVLPSPISVRIVQWFEKGFLIGGERGATVSDAKLKKRPRMED
jgi:hypothetical protein